MDGHVNIVIVIILDGKNIFLKKSIAKLPLLTKKEICLISQSKIKQWHHTTPEKCSTTCKMPNSLSLSLNKVYIPLNLIVLVCISGGSILHNEPSS